MEVVDGRESFPCVEEEDEEGATKEEEENVASWAELFGLARPELKWIGLGCVALLVRLPFSLASPHFQSEAIGAAINGKGGKLRCNVILLVATGAVNGLLDFWNVFLFDFSKARLLRRLRVRLFSAMLRQDRTYLDTTTSGWLASRLVADTAEMGNDLTWVFRWSIESAVRISGIVAYMFYRDWRLACVAVAVVPPCTAANYAYGVWLRRNAARVQAALAAAGAASTEALASSRTVAACAAEEFEIARYAKLVLAHYSLSVAQAIAQAAYYMLCYSILVGACVPAALLWVGGREVAKGDVKPSVLIAFMLYQGQLLEYTGQLLNSFTAMLKSSGSGGEVFKLLRRAPRTPHANYRRHHDHRVHRVGLSSSCDDSDDSTRTPLLAATAFRGEVEFRNVSFAYAARPGQAVLRDITLHAPPASQTAVVGASGSGKSTLFQLVLAFYEPTAGAVLLDNAPVASYDPASLRTRALGIVGQEPVLMDGTVLDNILYGSSRTDREVAVAAAKVARAHTFLADLPDGYDTKVGERGAFLSGGQKQRVAIARAIARNPAVLLLDEATSALDAESRAAVDEALNAATRGRTTLAITHNLAAVRDADAIVVMDQGAIVEVGAHQDLLDARGLYATLVATDRRLQLVKEQQPGERPAGNSR
ncbi:hypothetical protein CTAYLR_002898 [Chrysophaeum taylorii]|uniref:ABC transporter n=1 Tax=Chrysophaeum taylorii TaxID=2483200 RepID=A0AAD7UMU0_9STRA|nr:hypothetical protein CTAYLR_002898 [Chrysophaeum taylorii]